MIFSEMFLRRGSRVSVARGRDVFWGLLDRRSLDASRLGRGLGRLTGPPITRFFPNDWVFQKVVVVACESL
jgi:hypothetical protein